MLKLRITKSLLPAIAAVLMLMSAPVASYAKGWEPVKSERQDLKTVGKEADVEVKAARGVIHISTTRSVPVKVYTILGQVIASETLPAGNHQLTVATHGVYIVKVGDTLTAKVAI